MIIDTVVGIKSLSPTANFVYYIDNDNGGVGTIEWHSPDIQQPSDAEIQAEVIRLQAVYDSQEYARLRKAEYDKLNQFEMQFDDQQSGGTTWVDAVNEIKARHPK